MKGQPCAHEGFPLNSHLTNYWRDVVVFHPDILQESTWLPPIGVAHSKADPP